MAPSQFLRWGRLTGSPSLGEARLYCYTHAGQARIIRLDKSELGDLIEQAGAALAGIYRAESGTRCASCEHTASQHRTPDDLLGPRCRGGQLCRCERTRADVVAAASRATPHS